MIVQLAKNRPYFILVIFSLTLLFSFIGKAYAVDLTLSWDRPDDNRVAGYKIFYGESGTDFKSIHKKEINSPNVTDVLITGLEGEQIIGFTVKSIDSIGNESDFSEILYHFVPSSNDIDDDGDGYTENQGDYDDNNEKIYPGAPEIIGDGIDQDCDGSDLEYTPVPEGFVMENGEIQIDDQWIFVPLTKTFKNPIVVAKPMSVNDMDPAIIRIKNVNNDGFEIRIQEWDYLDGEHGLETVNYIVMEAGNHILPDGTLIEAGTFEGNNKIRSIALSEPFNEIPVILASVVTLNEVAAVAGRLRNIDAHGFEFQLQEEEVADRAHINETISYIAWEPSSGKIEDMTYEVARTKDTVRHYFNYIGFSTPFINSPVFIADMQTRDGGDTASVRWQNKDAYGVDVKITEEQSLNSETYHTTEIVGYLAIQNYKP
jgi:Putative metal-binding motif